MKQYAKTIAVIFSNKVILQNFDFDIRNECKRQPKVVFFNTILQKCRQKVDILGLYSRMVATIHCLFKENQKGQ